MDIAPEASCGESRNRFRPAAIAAVAAVALAAALAPLPLPFAAHRTLVILIVAAGLWGTEALPLPVTALLIPVLGIGLGVANAKEAFAGFGDPIVFLFFGTFLLTEASQAHGINARLARGVLSSRWVAASPPRLVFAVAMVGCGISAWVNNTATTAMMIPLALSARALGSSRLLTAVLLMTSYASSLGGLATPVGTAPNLIGLRLLEQATGDRPSFARWCAVFAPLAVVSTALIAGWLRFRSRDPGRSPATLETARETPAVAPPWSRAERTLVPLFIMVVLLWITPGILEATPLKEAAWVKTWKARLPEPAVPLIGGLLLFMLPASSRGRKRILDLSVLQRLDWSTLLLFGGGLSLGAMMFESGLARALGDAIFAFMPLHGTFGIVLAATLMAVLVSEVTSNTASASLVVPVVLALAQAAGVDPVKPALAATVGCSFGNMMPVSTPPNALVYATGRVTMRDMMANGLVLDVIGVLMVSVWVTLVG